MELPGETYLFNLSLIAVTFIAVSALVKLLRQTMGGKLSNFDVYLTTSFISFGFALAISALLPPLASFYELGTAALWAVSSGLAAFIMGAQWPHSTSGRTGIKGKSAHHVDHLASVTGSAIK